MGTITVRNIDDSTIATIERRAADRGVSMEEEVRSFLTSIYSDQHGYSDQRRREAREWTERQLERLKRGELPKAKISAVDEIRAIREIRAPGSRGPKSR